jgi:transposase
LRRENTKLRAENREIRAENKRLRDRIGVLETQMEERIKKAVEEAVAKAVEPLLLDIAEKDKEILRLKAQLDKDSTNSSKPPGGNGFKKVPNNREKSGKKQGGQRGHKGNRLNIPENLDELVAEGKAEHIVLSDVPEGEAYISDWIVDLKVVTVYTEHRRKAGRPPKIEYGPHLKAIAVYLCVMGLIAYQRLSQFFHEVSYNLITVSKDTLAGFNRSTANGIELGPYISDLLNGRVMNVDETPIKSSERPGAGGLLETSERTTFTAYIRTYSNSRTTVLTVNPHKTAESVIADNILTQFHGIVSQDHEAKFYNFGGLHATCGAHLARDLKGLSELQMLAWADDVRQFFLEMNTHKNHDVHGGKTVCEPDLLRRFEARYDQLLQAGKIQLEAMPPKSFGYDELRRMVNRLDKYKDSYLLFIRNYQAPFTNNQAERDLRHCKTKQKVSGCFRSWQGVLDYCKIRSLLATAKKRGENLLHSLFSLCSLSIPAG